MILKGPKDNYLNANNILKATLSVLTLSVA